MLFTFNWQCSCKYKKIPGSLCLHSYNILSALLKQGYLLSTNSYHVCEEKLNQKALSNSRTIRTLSPLTISLKIKALADIQGYNRWKETIAVTELASTYLGGSAYYCHPPSAVALCQAAKEYIHRLSKNGNQGSVTLSHLSWQLSSELVTLLNMFCHIGDSTVGKRISQSDFCSRKQQVLTLS